ncbi:hypothetical protein EI555_008779 [Monodon monoceros]|uniref:Uncharacterized protein n=1 Tax=Monodon monoceros TaxID=40151 RepID=A0A4U1FB45_MONMO|nr:hypothetical protein EI555_008779 [Monodon monoceros]
MAGSPAPSSQEALLLELKGLQQEPVEGVPLNPVDEGRLPTWAVAIFGPDTYDEGGYFKAPREPPRRPLACPGDHGARGAGRRAGAHHAGRVLREAWDPGARGDAELFHEDGEAEAGRCFWDDSQDLGTEKP